MRTARINLALGCAFCILLASQITSAKVGGRCDDDNECDDGFVCRLPPEADTDSGADTSSPKECIPDLEPCSSNADCEDGYSCEHHGVVAVSHSDSDGDASTVEARPVSGSTYCTPSELSCETHADCPEPAVCSGGECVFELNSCDTDADCDPRYVCASSKDESCDAEEAGVCEPRRLCFPPPKPCESDSECDGWLCYVLPQGNNPPFGWEALEQGCVPPGLIAVLEGRIEVGGDVLGKGESASASLDQGEETAEGEHWISGQDAATGAAPSGPTRADGSAGGGDAAASSDEDEPLSAGKVDDEEAPAADEGCGLANRLSDSSAWFGPLLAGTLLLGRRRRAQK